MRTPATVTVPAGMRYGDLARRLQVSGWALRNLPSLPHISAAGSVATATHGSGNDNQSLASAVTSMSMITGTSDRFMAARCGSRRALVEHD